MPEFRLPGDLTTLTRAELAELKTAAQAEMQTIMDSARDLTVAPYTVDDAAALNQLTAGLGAIAQAETKLDVAAAEISAAVESARGSLEAFFHTAPDDGGDAEDATVDEEAVQTPELVTASAPPRAKSEPVLRKPGLNERLRTASLREAAQHSPRVDTVLEPELIVTASADIPGVQMTSRIPDLDRLTDAFIARARSLPTSHGSPNYVPVASIRNVYETVLSDRTPPAEVEKAMRRLQDPSALWDNGQITTAGGGWCAPSENRYAFFDVTCEDGMIDLPTFGVERGGVNFPTSPSMADVFTGTFTSGTNPWLWTETDDIATVTGSPNKPCVRVPCPAFTNVRLECYGICLTAGNLTDNAYPEATRHQISLLRSALFRASNARYIQQMVTLSTPVVTAGAGGAGVISPVLYMTALAGEDYRTRFGMCQTDVLEVILPHWILEAMRADAVKRGGVDLICRTDNEIADWFDCRNIRAQFVSDWQVRASGLPGFTTDGVGFNSWPTSVDFLIYPAGTFQRGNGMTLDLGVVRDSTLNAENDHTALWMEECHLIARFGFQSRQYRVNICADGTTGAMDLTACTP